MRPNIGISTLVFGILSSATLCVAQSAVSSADLTAIAAVIQRDFGSIDRIDTISMADDTDGRFDIVVSGGKHGAWSGWRVEALRVDHHRIRTVWDSEVEVKEQEFENSGPKSIDVRVRDYDYDILIEGCVPRSCGDGISGFLVFSARTGKTFKAKVTTQGLDKPVDGPPKYDVTFSSGITDDAKKNLENAICGGSAISNKAGLPFECKSP
jgi:hypothetical protein